MPALLAPRPFPRRLPGMNARGRINRLVLPGLAFKAVVIGGGYATGRELVEFFLPSGAVGGIWAMLLAAAIWSGVCAITFLFAFAGAARPIINPSSAACSARSPSSSKRC